MKTKMESKKVAITGISGSGKSWVVENAINGIPYTELLIMKILATKQLETHKKQQFGLDINVWDFVGQSKIRQDYHKSKKEGGKREKAFGGTDLAIFIFDLSRPDEFDNASQELERVIESLESVAPESYIGILLHKIDLLSETPSEKEIGRLFGSKIKNKSRFLGFAWTTVKDDSCKKAIGDFFRKVFSISSIINDTIKDFLLSIKNIVSEAKLTLFDNEFLELGSAKLDHDGVKEIHLQEEEEYKDEFRKILSVTNTLPLIPQGLYGTNENYEYGLIKSNNHYSCFFKIAETHNLVLICDTSISLDKIQLGIEQLQKFIPRILEIYGYS